MIEKQMLRLMLNKNFYTQYRGAISHTIFSGDISSLYETIEKAHSKYDSDIKLDELYSLHTTVFNPALTRAAREKFSELVEDCASACAVSNILTGIAIMGTTLKPVHKSHLKPYKNLYICLDRDATTKAYDMAKNLRSSGFDNVIVKPLEDDLKYYNTDEIREIFYD